MTWILQFLYLDPQPSGGVGLTLNIYVCLFTWRNLQKVVCFHGETRLNKGTITNYGSSYVHHPKTWCDNSAHSFWFITALRFLTIFDIELKIVRRLEEIFFMTPRLVMMNVVITWLIDHMIDHMIDHLIDRMIDFMIDYMIDNTWSIIPDSEVNFITPRHVVETLWSDPRSLLIKKNMSDYIKPLFFYIKLST